MGSLLTEKENPKEGSYWQQEITVSIFRFENKQPIDSKKIAHQTGVPYVDRDFFLDNVKSEKNMKSIMASALLVEKNGETL